MFLYPFSAVVSTFYQFSGLIISGLYLSESNTEKPEHFNLGHTAAGYRHMIHGVKPKRINRKKISYSVRREKSWSPKGSGLRKHEEGVTG